MCIISSSCWHSAWFTLHNRCISRERVMRVMISAPLVDVSLTLVITPHSTRTKIHAEERDGDSNLAALLSTRTPHCKTCFHHSAHRLERRPLDLRVIRRAKGPKTPKVQQRIISQSTHTQHRATCKERTLGRRVGILQARCTPRDGLFRKDGSRCCQTLHGNVDAHRQAPRRHAPHLPSSNSKWTSVS